jgi:hypothetical protein
VRFFTRGGFNIGDTPDTAKDYFPIQLSYVIDRTALVSWGDIEGGRNDAYDNRSVTGVHGRVMMTILDCLPLLRGHACWVEKEG